MIKIYAKSSRECQVQLATLVQCPVVSTVQWCAVGARTAGTAVPFEARVPSSQAHPHHYICVHWRCHMLFQVLVQAGSSAAAMRRHRPEDDCVDRDGLCKVRARSVTEAAPSVEAATSLAAAEIKARRFASLSGAHAEQHVAEAV
eukprot:CAMPEP_0185187940 /NCGR_PEP_ID=MMETSP1140-20130426/5077_1 /TAXON_ID=298111 /ORGANISM="Pavlova sp., Strain CCMP459" /LENGTH=144 /DNA_ID=CAMNT_0027754399 /DNA_START=332 /DNA_END=762 /DNA_ORIENTATION=+